MNSRQKKVNFFHRIKYYESLPPAFFGITFLG